MARGKPVEIATRSFATQSEANKFFQEILYRYRPGERVGDEHALHLSALLERHPGYKTKIGCGVDYFEVMTTEHGTVCFRVVRKDGTGTDFSFKQCITGRAPSRKQEVSNAFRGVVRLDLYNARDEYVAKNKDAKGMVTCAETGESIFPHQAHMDHRAPMTFEVLVTTFLAARGLSIEDVPVAADGDDQVTPEINDPQLRQAFRDFHRKVALLDLVKDKTNLAMSGSQRIKPSRVKIPAERQHPADTDDSGSSV